MNIQEVEKMQELHQKGWSLRKIGREFGKSAESVRWFLTRYLDYDVTSQKNKDIERMEAMLTVGETVSSIAKKLGVNRSTVYRRLKGRANQE